MTIVHNDRGRSRRRRCRSLAPALGQLVKRRLSRRQLLVGAGSSIAATAFAPRFSQAVTATQSSSLGFEEIRLQRTEGEVLAKGYQSEVIVAWGDPLFENAEPFNPAAQTAETALNQFGVNNDFTVFLPFDDEADPTHGLLFVNHEYPNPHLMWPGLSEETAGREMTLEQLGTTMASVGCSVVEIRRMGRSWTVDRSSSYNRRISMSTPITLSGPAAGTPELITTKDPTGRTVFGTVSNCNGGVTPWGTVLTCEEGAGWIFAGDYQNTPNPELLRRYYYDDKNNDEYGWGRVDERFQLEREPNEPNRFEWVVEIDPFDPDSTPVKRTALGRFAHEGASTVLAPDGRLVVYLGDDWEFEYCYRFVSSRRVNTEDRDANKDLLDDGILSVARFEEDGKVRWLPLVFGQGPLTPDNGFYSQADILINTRRAADLLEATPMDSPEGFAPHPQTGDIYVALTSNSDRVEPNAANPRPSNRFGHLLELSPPPTESGPNHAASVFTWEVFALCGDPSNPDHEAAFHPETSRYGWFTDPDNIGFDPTGRLWVCTDGVQPSGHDALYVMDVQGPGRAMPRLFYCPPAGAECCSPTFSADGRTLFLAIQHPGEGVATLDETPTRWPDFVYSHPPRPAVIAITRIDGDIIGT